MMKKLISWKMEKFSGFLGLTSGWKTYFVAGLMFLYAVLGLIFDLHDGAKASEVILASFALVGIGHKLDKANK